MNGDMDIKALSDREILILLAERRHADKERMDVMDNRLGSHGKRIGSLESWRTFLFGAWAVLCLAGYLIAHVSK